MKRDIFFQTLIHCHGVTSEYMLRLYVLPSSINKRGLSFHCVTLYRKVYLTVKIATDFVDTKGSQ